MIHQTFNNAISPLLRKCKSVQHLKQIHAHLLKTYLSQSPYAIAPLLEVAATSGCDRDSFFSYACGIFKNLQQRNIFMYNSMIRGYFLSRFPKQAILCYLDLMDRGFLANKYTFPPLIKACALVYRELKRIGYLVHAHVIVLGYENDAFVVSALVEFYSLFDLKVARATEATFVSILAACTHAKMVERGLEFFDQMYPVYRVQPQFEHYACVVDLMARAGMVEDAEKFVEEKMGGFSNVDANVWGAILSACRQYRNIEIGDRIWTKLSALGLLDGGTQVLSYNIFSEAGREMAAKEVRKKFSEARSKKIPGCSVIVVDGAVQEFLAGDLSHPQVQHICEMLGFLSKMVKWETVK
ncbi:hypothetical protein Csa_000638 [Cucumis sativus]|nr:hypothetical protein Csa_000638 [Cucumis sativus]